MVRKGVGGELRVGGEVRRLRRAQHVPDARRAGAGRGGAVRRRPRGRGRRGAFHVPRQRQGGHPPGDLGDGRRHPHAWDNNPRADPDILRPAGIQGQVVAAWRGQRRRTIQGGRIGRLWALWLPVQRGATKAIACLLRRPYHALARSGALAAVLPGRLRPRAVRFSGRARHPMQLLFGGRIIGHYDVRRQRWVIRRPYGLLVDRTKLPTAGPSQPPR